MRFPTKILRYASQNLRCRCPLDHFGDFFIENLFFLFLYFSQILWAFCRKFFGNAFKKLILFVQKTRLTKYLFFFSKKNEIYRMICDIERKIIGHQPKSSFFRIAGAAIELSIGKFEDFFEKSLFFVIRWNCSKKRLFMQIFRIHLSKLHYTCPWEIFEEKFEKKMFIFGITLGRWEKNFGMWLNFSAELTKCIPSFLKVNLRKIVFSWKMCCFSIILRPWAKRFGLSQNVQRGCQSLHSRCPKDHFEETFLWKLFFSFPVPEH